MARVFALRPQQGHAGFEMVAFANTARQQIDLAAQPKCIVVEKCIWRNGQINLGSQSWSSLGQWSVQVPITRASSRERAAGERSLHGPGSGNLARQLSQPPCYPPVCTCRSHMGWSVQRMLQSAAMGGMLGAGGVVAGSLIQGGRLPPRSQIGAAAAMMATVLGVGSVVRS